MTQVSLLQTTPMTAIGTRLTQDTIAQLVKLSKERHVAKTSLMRFAIEKYLSEQKETPIA